MRPPLDTIQRYLSRLTRRRLGLVLMRDLGIAITILGMGLLGILLAGLLEPDAWVELRRGAATFGISVVGLWLVAVLRALHGCRYEATMTLLATRHPTLTDNLRSALELAVEAHTGRPRFSLPLFRALTVDCAQRLGHIPPSALSPARRLTPIAVSLSLTALLWAMLATLAPDPLARAVQALRLAHPTASSLRNEPLLGDLRLHLAYPAYMARPARKVQNSTGQITAPPGTRVTLEAEALQPLRDLVLVFEGKQRPAQHTPLKLSGKGTQRRAQGAFVVSTPGRYYFSARLVDGERVRDPAQRRIDIEPDAAPTVTIYGPQDDLEVSPENIIEVGYTASDDHGLRELRLAYRLGLGAIERRRLWIANKGERPPRRHVDKLEWNLAAIDLSQGGRLEYWLEGVDNNVVSGPKVSRSKTLHLRIFSPNDRHDRTLATQRQLLDAALKLLAGRLLLFDEQNLAPDRRLLRAKDLHRQQKRVLDAARDLENKMREDRQASAATLRAVAHIRAQLDKHTATDAQVLHAIGGHNAHQLRPLARENQRQVVTFEDVVLRLASLLDEQKLQRLRSAGERLMASRRQLQRLINEYRRARSPELKQRIQAEIARLQRQLKELMMQLARMEGSIADEHINADAVASLALPQQLAKLDALFRRGDMKGVDKALAELDAQLQSMGGMLEGNLEGFRSERFAARERAFGAAMDQVHDLQRQQQRLTRRTGDIITRYHHRASEMLRHQVAPQLRAQRKELNKLSRTLDNVQGRRLAAYQRDQLNRIKGRVKLLDRALLQQDLAQALEMAQLLHGGLRTLRDDVREDALDRSLWRRPTLRALRRIRGATSQAAEIETDLEALLPGPQRLLTPTERQNLREGRRKQQRLQQELEKLGTKLGEGPAKGAFGPRARQNLQRAGTMMDEAARQLLSLRPKLAHAAQREAGDALGELRKQAHRSRAPRTSASGRRHRVRIPGADDFKAPDAFRGDLLDAMKEPAPPGYDGPVRRYYRELVR
ncbi:MAG: hypothetical protein JRH20_10735 [Deltaproteobacteria bacterium]|nr:hypothetical protein [Deltaproteobacteria bacterium]